MDTNYPLLQTKFHKQKSLKTRVLIEIRNLSPH